MNRGISTSGAFIIIINVNETLTMSDVCWNKVSTACSSACTLQCSINTICTYYLCTNFHLIPIHRRENWLCVDFDWF